MGKWKGRERKTRQISELEQPGSVAVWRVGAGDYKGRRVCVCVFEADQIRAGRW